MILDNKIIVAEGFSSWQAALYFMDILDFINVHTDNLFISYDKEKQYYIFFDLLSSNVFSDSAAF